MESLIVLLNEDQNFRRSVSELKSPIQSKINTVFVHVKDLKPSVKWYSNLLGQSFDPSSVADPVHNIYVNNHTGLTLDAGPPNVSKDFTPSPYPLFNLHTSDIDQSYHYVKELNYQIDSEVIRFDDVSFFNVRDLDGNIIMICEG